MKKNAKHYAVICTLFLWMTTGVAYAANDVLAQTVTANFYNATLDEVIWELKKQTDFTFIYNTEDVRQVKVKNLNAEAEDVTDILDKCLENSDLSYTIHKGVVAIRKVASSTSPALPASQQQTYKVEGVVADEMGEPLLGVNIVIKGTTRGAVSDMDGRFTITLPDNKPVTLQVSYIGFATQEVQASPGQTLRIVMEDDTEVLGEVIVTGYGTFKKEAFAGSASTVKMQDKADVPATDFKALLQGSAAGLQVNSTSGTVGGTSSITIRGMGSINASTSPLFVIDGVPVISSISSNVKGGTDIMSTLNNSDIENITVIKDAAAASLYGSRAANGVILITTKTGKEGKPSFNLKADWGFSDYSMKFYEVMDGPERREVLHEGLVNQGLYLKKMTREEAIAYANESIDEYAPIPWSGWENWEKALFNNNAPYQNYDFSVSGGDKKTSYYSSIAYMNQDGIVRQQGFDRITARLNVKYNMTERLQLGANILYSKLTQLGSGDGTTYTSPIYASRHKLSASDPIYNEDGTYNQEMLSMGKRNPKSALDYNYDQTKVDRSFNTLYANYRFMEGLTFNSTFSLDNNSTWTKAWNDPRSTDGQSDNGSLSNRSYQVKQMVWKNNLTYITTINDIHHLDVLGGYETHQYETKNVGGTIKDFPTTEKHQISNGSNITGFTGSSSGWRMVSYLARANYDYDNKYYLGASVRVDGTSRLHPDSRWGTFWSASGAWRISQESFMENIKPVVDDLKLRFSYGSNGTLPTDYFAYMNLSGFGYNYNGKPGILDYQLGRKELKWEKNYNMNLGLDFRLFNRIGATIEVYERKSSDLLMEMPISMVTGFTNIWTNIGRLRNRGIELELNADILQTNGFNWNMGLNLGHNQNRVMSLGDQDQIVGTYTIRKVGQPYRTFYVKEFAGINPETGFPQYYINDPESDDPKAITEDATKANYISSKSADPKLSGGWNNSFRYKMFDLSFLWTFTLGGYSYDHAASKLEHGGLEAEHALQTLYRDRWRQPGDKTDIEMVMVGNKYDMSGVVNSRRIHSTDHLRLKNLTLGISLPKNLARRMYLENVRAYFSATNLLTFAAYDRYDPELGASGVSYFDSPKMKTLTFGIDIKF